MRLETEKEHIQIKFDRLGNLVSNLRDSFYEADTVLAEPPLINWNDRLKEYLKKFAREKKRTTTVATRRKWLQPWVRWLWKHGLRPTSQRIKQYLAEKDLKVGSYYNMGTAITEFTNHWSETWNEVKLVRSLGQLPEKDTLTMPQEALESLQAHVKLRTTSFGSQAEKLTTQDHAMTLAKDLGKYSLRTSTNSVQVQERGS